MSYTCKNCYFKHSGEMRPDLTTPAECRRFPPIPHAVPIQGPQGMGLQMVVAYPQVGDDYPACGEYEADNEPGDFQLDT